MLLVLRANCSKGQLKQVTLECRPKICLKKPYFTQKKSFILTKKKKKITQNFFFHYNIYKYILYIYNHLTRDRDRDRERKKERERETYKKRGKVVTITTTTIATNITKKKISFNDDNKSYIKKTTLKYIYFFQGGRSRVLINKSTKK